MNHKTILDMVPHFHYHQQDDLLNPIFGTGTEWSQYAVADAASKIAASFDSAHAFDVWHDAADEREAAAFLGEEPARQADRQGYGAFTSPKYWNLLKRARRAAFMQPDTELIDAMNAAWGDGFEATPAMYVTALLGDIAECTMEEAAEASSLNSRHAHESNLAALDAARRLLRKA